MSSSTCLRARSSWSPTPGDRSSSAEWRPDFPREEPTDISSSTRRRSPCSTWRSAIARPGTEPPTPTWTWRHAWRRGNGSLRTRTEAPTSERSPHQERPPDRSEKQGRREAGRFHSGWKNRGTREGPRGISRRTHDSRGWPGGLSGPDRPLGALERTGFRVQGDARVGNAGRGRGRHHEPSMPARHRPAARRAGAGGDAQAPGQESQSRPRVSGRRAHLEARRGAAHRNGGAARRGLRRVFARRYADSRHAGPMVRAAKKEGLPVSSDISAHHAHLSDIDLGYFDSHCHVIPPFRSLRDRDALRSGLADGTIDALCSDHAPVDEDAKQLPFAESEPGVTGLELLLPLALKWAGEARVALPDALATVTSKPAAILGVPAGDLAAGRDADVCVFDPNAHVKITADFLKSQGKNTPFIGYELPGRVRYTLVSGEVVYEA